MFLITSAAYIDQDLRNEFGFLPPSFLPVQNKRLYQIQLEQVLKGSYGQCFLSIPNDFESNEFDSALLESLGVEIIRVPHELSLGQSVVFCLNIICEYTENLYILHGDTLILDMPTEPDVYSIEKSDDFYNWSYSKVNNDNRKFIYSGFFSFSNISKLIKSITENGFDFINGINSYKNQMTVEERICKWLDFGHITTYYRSKGSMTTERVFNDLTIDGTSVKKSSTNENKILGEANWFQKLPATLKTYTPQFIQELKSGYEIEYLHMVTLSELYVFGKQPPFVWRRILSACDSFVHDCRKYSKEKSIDVDVDSFGRMYLSKTMSRLQEFSDQSGVDLKRNWIFNDQRVPSLEDLALKSASLIRSTTEDDLSIIHGDYCFSNILYDFRSQSIKLIDPRGVGALGEETIYGDSRYDIAKFAHSIIGQYDHIISGYYNLTSSNNKVDFRLLKTSRIDDIQKTFGDMSFGGYSLETASTYPILIQLFLSMLPLHSDNPTRQLAFIANSYRIFVTFLKEHI